MRNKQLWKRGLALGLSAALAFTAAPLSSLFVAKAATSLTVSTETLKYTGEEQSIATYSLAEGDAIKYVVLENENTNIAEADLTTEKTVASGGTAVNDEAIESTSGDVGTYHIYYVTGSYQESDFVYANTISHETKAIGAASPTVTVSVGEAKVGTATTLNATITPVGSDKLSGTIDYTITYSDEGSASVSNVKVENNTAEAATWTPSKTGTVTVSATFTPDASFSNYTTGTGTSASVTVGAGTLSADNVTLSATAKYGDEISTTTISAEGNVVDASNNTVAGEWSFVQSGVVKKDIGTDSTSYTAKFTPTNASYYGELTGKAVSVTVSEDDSKKDNLSTSASTKTTTAGGTTTVSVASLLTGLDDSTFASTYSASVPENDYISAASLGTDGTVTITHSAEATQNITTPIALTFASVKTAHYDLGTVTVNVTITAMDAFTVEIADVSETFTGANLKSAVDTKVQDAIAATINGTDGKKYSDLSSASITATNFAYKENTTNETTLQNAGTYTVTVTLTNGKSEKVKINGTEVAANGTTTVTGTVTISAAKPTVSNVAIGSPVYGTKGSLTAQVGGAASDSVTFAGKVEYTVVYTALNDASKNQTIEATVTGGTVASVDWTPTHAGAVSVTTVFTPTAGEFKNYTATSDESTAATGTVQQKTIKTMTDVTVPSIVYGTTTSTATLTSSDVLTGDADDVMITATATLTTADQTNHVGTDKAVTLSNYQLADESGNYKLDSSFTTTDIDSKLKAEITAAPLTFSLPAAVANGTTVDGYADALAAANFTATGLAFSQTIGTDITPTIQYAKKTSGTYAMDKTSTISEAGTYGVYVTALGGTYGSDYTIANANNLVGDVLVAAGALDGTVSVKKGDEAVTAANVGDELTATVTGLSEGATATYTWYNTADMTKALATGASYTVKASDYNTTLKVVVTDSTGTFAGTKDYTFGSTVAAKAITISASDIAIDEDDLVYNQANTRTAQITNAAMESGYYGTATITFSAADADSTPSSVGTITVYNGNGDSPVVSSAYTMTYSGNASEELAAYKITKAEPSPTYPNDITNGSKGETGTFNTQNANGATVTYQSNDTSVITIDASTGAYTLVGAGTTTVTVNVAESANYLATTGTVNVTVVGAHTITINDDYGTATPSTADNGDTVTITAKSRDGYTFSGWTVVSGGVTLADATKAETTFTMGDNDVELTAGYTKNATNVTPPATSNTTSSNNTNSNTSSETKPETTTTTDPTTGAKTETTTSTSSDGTKTVEAVTTNTDGSKIESTTTTKTDTTTGATTETAKETTKDASGNMTSTTETTTVTEANGDTKSTTVETDANGAKTTTETSTTTDTETGVKTETKEVTNADGSGEVSQTVTETTGASTSSTVAMDSTGAATEVSTTTVNANGKTTEAEYDVTSGKNITLETVETTTNKIAIPATVKAADGKTYKVTEIAKNAAKGSETVKTVEIGNNVKKVGASAFANCKKLTKATIGKNVTSIAKNTFKGDSKLKTVTLQGAKVTSVGKNAFSGIAKNATISIKGSAKQVKKVANLIKKSGVAKTVTIKRAK